MQRHWNDEVAEWQEIGAGPDHPLRHGTGEIRAVSIFQARRQLETEPMVDDRRARHIERRWIGQRRRADLAVGELQRAREAVHGHPAPHAVDADRGRTRGVRADRSGGRMMNIFSGIGGIILFALDIWAIASIINSGATGKSKVIWVLVVAILPVAGLIAWWFMGPKANYQGRV